MSDEWVDWREIAESRLQEIERLNARIAGFNDRLTAAEFRAEDAEVSLKQAKEALEQIRDTPSGEHVYHEDGDHTYMMNGDRKKKEIAVEALTALSSSGGEGDES